MQEASHLVNPFVTSTPSHGEKDSKSSNSASRFNDRVFMSGVFSIILQWLILYSIQVTLDFLQLFFNFNILHLSFWDALYHPFKFIFESVFSFAFIGIILAVVVLTWIDSRKLKWSKTFEKAPMSLKQYLKPKLSHGLYIFGYFLIGIFLSNVYLRFLQRSNYTYTPQPTKKIGETTLTAATDNLDERLSFILLSSGLLAAWHYVTFSSSCDYIVKFPMLETSSYIRFRSLLGPPLREAYGSVLRLLPVSYLINLIAGSYFHHFICFVKNAGHNAAENSKLVSFLDYWDLELIFILTICQVLVMFILKTVWMMLEILLTLRVKFPIESRIPGTGNFVLSDMMASNTIYLRKMAFYDLKLLTEFEEYRMKTLFNLSHPGGNPKIWSAVSKSCIHLVQNLTNGLNSYIDKVAGDRKIAEQSSLGHLSRQLGPRADFIFSNDELSAGDKIRYRFNQAAMRNLNLPDDHEVVRRKSDTDDQVFAFWFNPFASIFKLTSFYATQLTSYAGKLFSAMNFWIYTEDKEAEIANLFHDPEMILWSINALADVVVASNKVDDKGVVQKDIRLILTTLVDLCIALDTFRAVKEKLELEQNVNVQEKTKVPKFYVRNLVRGIRKPLKNEIMRIHFNCHHYYSVLCVPSYCEEKLRKLNLE